MKQKDSDCNTCPLAGIIEKIKADAAKARSLSHFETKQRFVFLKGKQLTYCKIFPN